MYDCHEVFSELLLGAFTIAALNDESATSLIDDPLDDFGGKARKSVLVGNHNSFDCSSLDLLQKPREPFAFVVEARADVLEDLVPWVRFLKRGDLALEVVFLFLRGDSGVDGALRLQLGFDLGGAGVLGQVGEAPGWLLVDTSLDTDDVLDVVAPLSPRSSDKAELSICNVLPDGGGGHSEDGRSHCRRDEFLGLGIAEHVFGFWGRKWQLLTIYSQNKIQSKKPQF